MTAFAAYSARNSGRSRQEVLDACNESCFHGYSAPPDAESARAYPVRAYEELLETLAGTPHLEVVTHRELCEEPAGGDRVRVTIRHDVDADIVAALQQARLEARFGLRSTFFVLHTAAYHGAFSNGVFVRNECIVHLYREIQELGHEVALHNDGLGVYQDHGVDGAEAVRAEIGWLRDNGIELRGTVAHGSKAAYGAENFELFKGRVAKQARSDAPELQQPTEYSHHGAPAMLHVLDERELGLDYEGNDIFFQDRVPVEYGATRTVDGWRWNRFMDEAVRETGEKRGILFCPQARVLRDLERLEPGCCGVLTVHPCYYGSRSAPGSSPDRRRSTHADTAGGLLGWPTYGPDQRHAWAGPSQAQEYQTIQDANCWGLLDRPPLPAADGDLGVLLLGADHLDGREVAGGGQVSTLLERRAFRATGRRVRCWRMARHDLGMARAIAWLRLGLETLKPDVVVLTLGTQELRRSIPEVWSLESGFSRHHPPGEYLDVRAGALVEVPRSRRWKSRQRLAREASVWPGTDVPVAHAASEETLPTLRGAGVSPWEFLSICYVELARVIQGAGAKGLLLMTDSGEATGPASETQDVLPPAFRMHARGVAEAAGLPCVDPTEEWPAVQTELGPVHFSDGAWTAAGHEAAARALWRALAAGGPGAARDSGTSTCSRG